MVQYLCFPWYHLRSHQLLVIKNTEAWKYQRKLDKLKLSPDERKASHLVDTYFVYARQARKLWSKIYISKDKDLG